MEKNLKIIFYSGAGTVTGSNFVIDNNKSKIMIDCGLIQGGNKTNYINSKPFNYNPKDIDILFVTHAHIDHIGRIPKLVKEGFKGKIFSTTETKEIVPLMFEDAISVMRFEEQRGGRKPIYSMDDVKNTMSLWNSVDYYKTQSIGDFEVTLKNAGHILGSAMVEILYKDKKILFTGDLGNSPEPLLKDTDEVKEVNYLVIESVYGDRNHKERDSRTEKLKKIIEDTTQKEGTLVIPSFSLERTQILLYELNNLIENKEVKSIPVFLDSPLAIKITEIYRKHTENFNKKTQGRISSGDDIFNFPNLKFTPTKDDSREISAIKGPKIVIAGSGMSNGGRVIFHEKNYLSDPKNTILFVGFQVAGTLGRKILEGLKNVRIFKKNIRVRAKIESILTYSAHKDSDGLLDFVNQTKDSLEKVYVVMGEPKASMFLAQRIRDYLEIDAVVPEVGQTFELEF